VAFAISLWNEAGFDNRDTAHGVSRAVMSVSASAGLETSADRDNHQQCVAAIGINAAFADKR
jgi:hypothetical protein